MNTAQISDSVFEALFRQAVIDNFFDELDCLPSEKELKDMYFFTAGHEARMKRLFMSEARKEKIRRVLSRSKRAAAVLVVTVTILFASLMLVSEVRATVAQTFVQWYETFVRFTATAPEIEKTGAEPTFIPAGFWEEFRDELELITIILYLNAQGEVIIFESGRYGGLLSVAAEGRAYEVMLIDGAEYHVFTANGAEAENAVVWEASGQVFSITSTIPIDELLNMATSVQ